MQTFDKRGVWAAWATAILLGAGAWLAPSSASAALNGGVEYGLVKRNADAPRDFKLGTGWGAHLEATLIPMINLGPYYLHYELASSERSTSLTHDSAFDTLGLRARFMLPLPQSHWKPYAYAGFGYTWLRYPTVPLAFEVSQPAMRVGGYESREGHFFEVPVGIGVAYELARILHLSGDFAVRPGMGFGGTAYDRSPRYSEPKWGYSLMLGVALDL